MLLLNCPCRPSAPKEKLNEFLGKPYMLYPLCALLLIGTLGIGLALQKKRGGVELAKIETPAEEQMPEVNVPEAQVAEIPEVVPEETLAIEPDGPMVELSLGREQLSEVSEIGITDEALNPDLVVEHSIETSETPAVAVVELAVEPESVEPTALAIDKPLVAVMPPEEPVVEETPALEEKTSPPELFALPKLEFVSTKIDIDELVGEIKGAPELVIDSGGFISEIADVAISPDGKFVAAAGGKVVRIWEIESGELLDTLRGDRDRTACGDCQAVEFSSDGQFLVVGVNDYAAHGSIRVYRVDTSTCNTSVRNSIDQTLSIAS